MKGAKQLLKVGSFPHEGRMEKKTMYSLSSYNSGTKDIK